MGNKPTLLEKTKSLPSRLFAKYFAFNTGVDIADEVNVLYRRNVVIKNLILLSNVMFALIFLFLSIFRNNAGDWLITAVFFPLTFAINGILKKLIHVDVQDKTKLEVAMYVATFYMFLSSILVYIRLMTGQLLYVDGVGIRLFEAAGYVLIFYSLVLVSLYQNRKLLRNSFLASLAVVTIVHFTVTYAVLGVGYTFGEFWRDFFRSAEFADIILRTVVFIMFYLVVFTIVSIGEQIANERKEELIKRRRVQNDFTHIVKDLFSVVLLTSKEMLSATHAVQVRTLADELGRCYHLPDEEMVELNEYAVIHLQYDDISNILIDDSDHYDEKTFIELKEKTSLGAIIAKRVQLAQKAENINRAIEEDKIDEDFIRSSNLIQPELIAQIILIADIYLILRQDRPYKRPMSHVDAINEFKTQLVKLFSHDVFETFMRYQENFETLYNSLSTN